MPKTPAKLDLVEALNAAAAAHHEYERVTLEGKRDEQWAGFYAAYVLGQLGDFALPNVLTRWLKDAPSGENWSASTADHVLALL